MSVKRCQQEVDSAEFAEWMILLREKEDDNISDSSIKNPLGIEKTIEAIYGSH